MLLFTNDHFSFFRFALEVIKVINVYVFCTGRDKLAAMPVGGAVAAAAAPAAGDAGGAAPAAEAKKGTI